MNSNCPPGAVYSSSSWKVISLYHTSDKMHMLRSGTKVMGLMGNLFLSLEIKWNIIHKSGYVTVWLEVYLNHVTVLEGILNGHVAFRHINTWTPWRNDVFFFFAQISTKEDYSEYFTTIESNLPLDSNSSALIITDSCHNYSFAICSPFLAPSPHTW